MEGREEGDLITKEEVEGEMEGNNATVLGWRQVRVNRRQGADMTRLLVKRGSQSGMRGEAGGRGKLPRECPEVRIEEENRVEPSCGSAAPAPSTTSKAILYVRCAASPGTSPLSAPSQGQWRG